MASKRDQLQAYQFLLQRAISALVIRETDPEQFPFRRPATASMAGVALAIVALACAGVYGMIVPGGATAWRKENTVIVEKETGTRYIWTQGRLYPVTNYASALLLAGTHAKTERVSRDSLVGVPRGPRLGIPDAPDALPGPDRLLTGSWSLCSAPAIDVTGGRIDESVLLVGAAPGGGRPLGEQALLAQLAPTGARFLIWRGHRHPINDYSAVGAGLALTTLGWVRVGQAWLDVLPLGAAIEPIPLPEAGKPSTAVPGRTDLRIGALLMVQASGGRQYYLAERDSLRPITESQYDIQRAYPPTLAAYPGAEPQAYPIAPTLAASARQPSPVTNPAPSARPEIAALRDRETTVCTTFEPGEAVPRLTVDPALPPADPMAATTRRTSTGTPLADRVHVPAGWAAVVEAMPSPHAPAGTLTVVTDLGRRYPVADPEVLGMLGFPANRAVRLPAGLVARLPDGPGLDPATARRQSLGS